MEAVFGGGVLVALGLVCLVSVWPKRRYLLVLAENGATELRWAPRKFEHHLPYILDYKHHVVLVVGRLRGRVIKRFGIDGIGLMTVKLGDEWFSGESVPRDILVSFRSNAYQEIELRELHRMWLLRKSADARAGFKNGRRWGSYVSDALYGGMRDTWQTSVRLADLVYQEDCSRSIAHSTMQLAEALIGAYTIFKGDRLKTTMEGGAALTRLISLAQAEIVFIKNFAKEAGFEPAQLGEFFATHLPTEQRAYAETRTHALNFVGHTEIKTDVTDLGRCILLIDEWLTQQAAELNRPVAKNPRKRSAVA